MPRLVMPQKKPVTLSGPYPAVRLGWETPHPVSRGVSMSVFDRIIRNSVRNPDTGCWEWQGEKNQKGYPRISYRGRQIAAHRLSFQCFAGDIPDRYEVDHLCKNRGCINPDHLEAVTHIENCRRGDLGAHMSSRTHCPKGHEYTPENTYVAPRGARYCRICLRAKEARRRSRGA